MLEVNRPDVLEEVRAVFCRYEKALVSNDIEELDLLFWQSGSVVRLGAAENLYSYEQIRDFRRQRSPKGLDRTLSNTVIVTFGTDFASATTEFRKTGSQQLGRQTHSWVRFPDGWKIVAAHVSVMTG